MKKVFHIISHFDVGGAERVAVNIAKSRTDGFEYHVVELIRARSKFTRVFMQELDDAGIRYHRAYVPDVRFHYLFERLAAYTFPLWFLPLFLKHRPAVVHSHTEMPDLAVWWFFRLFPRLLHGCKVVRTIHNTRLWNGMEGTGRRVERFFIHHDSNVAISASVRDSYEKEYHRRAPMIYNGVAETPQRPYDGLVQGKINILFAGRFEPQKGVSTLIGIIKRMKDDGRFHFHIIGDGSLKPDIGREVGPLDCVTMRPPVHGLAACLSSFDYLLMPSEFEGLSIMSIEASMAGLPVVANDCPGLGDTLPPSWLLKVSGNDDEAFLRLFRDVIPRSDLRSLGAEAKAYAMSRFGIRHMQEEYERIYLG